MPQLLASQLLLQRCPHCNVDNPNIYFGTQTEPQDFRGVKRFWRIYICARCAGAVLAEADGWDMQVHKIFPASVALSEDIPERSRAYLDQAMNSLSSPAGAVMLAASAVDAMLRAKELKAGTLYSRIDEAAKAHLITSDMALWAHEVRLDANDQRHADDSSPLPDQEQARKCVEFAMALGQFLFVLPARVQRGILSAKVGSGG